MGDSGSVNRDPASQQHFGGHTMIMRCDLCAGVGGRGRFANVEFWRMGQDRAEGLGRYPVHFHMLKEQGEGQYVRNCSFHDTFNRAITIHGTDSVVVRDNVGYRNQGHAVFLEDGSEMYNVIDRNLMIETVRPEPGDEVIPSDNSMSDFQDRSPSCFWITNPHNQVTDNVAAGTRGSGFWMAFPRQVLGLSAVDPDINRDGRKTPIKLPFMEDAAGESLFRGNRAHSCRLGIHFNDTVTDDSDGFVDDPTSQANGITKNTSWIASKPVDPSADIADPLADRVGVVNDVLDFTAYGCYAGIYTSTGGNQVRFKRYVGADCHRLVDFASFHTIEDSALVEEGRFLRYEPGDTGGWTGIQIYDGAGHYKNVLVRGFALGPVTLIGVRGAAVLHPSNTVEEFTYHFPNAPAQQNPRILFGVFNNGGSIYTGPPPGLNGTGLCLPNTDCIDDPIPGNPNDPLYASPIYDYAPCRWGAVIRDNDGSVTGTPDTSLVTLHPWFQTDSPSEHPYVYQAGLPSRAFVVGSQFGHLRFMYFDHAGVRKSIFGNTAGNYAITREYPPAFSGRSLRFNNLYRGREHKQLPIIVADAVNFPDRTWRHRIEHLNLSDFFGQFGSIEIVLDDCQAGQAIILELADFQWLGSVGLSGTRELPSGQTVALTEHVSTSLSTATSDPYSSLHFDPTTGKVHLIVRVRDNAPDGSPPAGRANKFRQDDPTEPIYRGSVNTEDSPWRREVIVLSWQ